MFFEPLPFHWYGTNVRIIFDTTKLFHKIIKNKLLGYLKYNTYICTRTIKVYNMATEYKTIVINQKTGKTIKVDANCLYLGANGRDCSYMYNCCSCGDADCGCAYCFDCRACEHCKNENN